MTEKRFTTSDTDILCMTIIDNENGKHYGFARDIAIVMNELTEENQELKLLLREVEHELTTLTGLTATDSTSIVKEDIENYGLFRLDYTRLLKKIDKVIE